jgi:hypothetical protein
VELKDLRPAPPCNGEPGKSGGYMDIPLVDIERPDSKINWGKREMD